MKLSLVFVILMLLSQTLCRSVGDENNLVKTINDFPDTNGLKGNPQQLEESSALYEEITEKTTFQRAKIMPIHILTLPCASGKVFVNGRCHEIKP